MRPEKCFIIVPAELAVKEKASFVAECSLFTGVDGKRMIAVIPITEQNGIEADEMYTGELKRVEE